MHVPDIYMSDIIFLSLVLMELRIKQGYTWKHYGLEDWFTDEFRAFAVCMYRVQTLCLFMICNNSMFSFNGIQVKQAWHGKTVKGTFM